MDPKVDWLLIFTNLASGAWTMERAAAYANMSVTALEAQIVSARLLGGRMADLAVRIMARYGITAAATAPATTGLAVTALRTGAMIIGLSLLAGVVLLGGYAAYRYFSSPDPSQTSVGSGVTQEAPCPSPMPKVREKCPWTPEGYEVQECQTGYCWDGGPQGSLACKQRDSVPNSRRTYTNDLNCQAGYKAERDPCTNVILNCVKE